MLKAHLPSTPSLQTPSSLPRRVRRLGVRPRRLATTATSFLPSRGSKHKMSTRVGRGRLEPCAYAPRRGWPSFVSVHRWCSGISRGFGWSERKAANRLAAHTAMASQKSRSSRAVSLKQRGFDVLILVSASRHCRRAPTGKPPALSRATHASALPQNGLLLERLAIRLDNSDDRLPRRRRIGMDQEQDLRLLVIDAASG